MTTHMTSKKCFKENKISFWKASVCLRDKLGWCGTDLCLPTSDICCNLKTQLQLLKIDNFSYFKIRKQWEIFTWKVITMCSLSFSGCHGFFPFNKTTIVNNCIGKSTLIAKNIYRSLCTQLLTYMVKKVFILLVVETKSILYQHPAGIQETGWNKKHP